METTKQVTKKEAAQLPAEFDSAWGTEGTDTRDILIPKLLVMQGLSELVTQERAQMGDFCNSVTGEVVGTAREKGFKPVVFIPIMTFKTWVIYEKIGDKLEFKEIIPMTPANSNWEMEEEVNGATVRRDRCINFFVLVEGQTGELPYSLTFRRTSYRAGQKLATHFKTCELAAARGRPVPPAAKTFKLIAHKETNDHGTFYVLDVEPNGDTKQEDLKTAYEWYQVLKTRSVKVDDSDVRTDGQAASTIDTDRF